MNDATTGVTHAVVEAVLRSNRAAFTAVGSASSEIQGAMTTSSDLVSQTSTRRRSTNGEETRKTGL